MDILLTSFLFCVIATDVAVSRGKFSFSNFLGALIHSILYLVYYMHISSWGAQARWLLLHSPSFYLLNEACRPRYAIIAFLSLLERSKSEVLALSRQLSAGSDITVS